MKYYFLLALSVALVSCVDPTPSRWPSTWTANYTATFKNPLRGDFISKGKWSYDDSKGRFAIDLKESAGDPFCSSVFPFSNKKCKKVFKEGSLFLDFPQEKYCCKCCKISAKGACNYIKPDFVSTAKFVQTFTDSTGKYNQFSIDGKPSYIYESDETGIPRRIFMQPQSDIAFNSTTIINTVDDSDFEISDNCQRCPIISYCSVAWLV